jgi:L-fucose isomerase-like protein
MGNTFVDLSNNIFMLSHCVAPTKMAGYDKSPHPYILRDQHWDIPLGSVSASVALEPGQEVTVSRLDGQLKNMLITKGEIADCQDLKDQNYCRITVKIKLGDSIRKFIGKTSGNHHIMVYGDHREEIRALNELFEITTTEV